MSAVGASDLAIVIPTRNRRETLVRMLRSLVRHGPAGGTELIVVDDGSCDGSATGARALDFPTGWRVEVVSVEPGGPAAARNAGAARARAPVLLFLGDDSMCTPGLIEEHLRFHRDLPQQEAAMLGLVEPCPPLDQVDLQRWLHTAGVQFSYGSIEPGASVSPACFWTSNVSVKRELFLGAGGFDESFRDAACEDAELGVRLARHGMELSHRAQALALHFHPTDLALTLTRMVRVGTAFRQLTELAPEIQKPPRPRFRHRLKAAALEAECRLASSRRARERTWRFLCDQMLREAYWEARPAGGDLPMTGSRLARMALDWPESNPPTDVEPDEAG